MALGTGVLSPSGTHRGWQRCAQPRGGSCWSQGPACSGRALEPALEPSHFCPGPSPASPAPAALTAVWRQTAWHPRGRPFVTWPLGCHGRRPARWPWQRAEHTPPAWQSSRGLDLPSKGSRGGPRPSLLAQGAPRAAEPRGWAPGSFQGSSHHGAPFADPHSTDPQAPCGSVAGSFPGLEVPLYEPLVTQAVPLGDCCPCWVSLAVTAGNHWWQRDEDPSRAPQMGPLNRGQALAGIL